MIASLFLADEWIRLATATRQRIVIVELLSGLISQLSYSTSSHLHFISSPAATNQLVCSGAAFIYIGRSVAADLQCVSSTQYTVHSLAGKPPLGKVLAFESVQQPFAKSTLAYDTTGLIIDSRRGVATL